MLTGITEKALKGFGALKIELNIIFRGDAYTAVELNAAAGVKEKRLTAVGFTDAGRLSESLSIAGTGEKLIGNTGGIVEP